MSAEDRDPKFERALAEHLRGGSPHRGCPDAETLAAYHERSLTLEEMAHWKQHIAGCAACQETLSLVEVTERQLAEDWEGSNIPVLEAAGRETVSNVGAANAELNATATALPVNSAPVSIARMRRPVLLRWAVPVGAVAAGVLVWIGIHERGAQHSAVSLDNVQVAENRPQSAPAQSYSEATPKAEAQAERDRVTERLDAGAARTNAPAQELAEKSGGRFEQKTGAAAAGDSLRKKGDTFASKTPAPAAGTAGGVIAATPPASSRSTSSAAPAAPPPPSPAPKAAAKEQAPGPVTETVEATSAAPPVSTSGPKTVDLPSGQGAGNGPEDQKHIAALSKSKSAMQQSADSNTNAMMMKQGINGREINSLNTLTPWVGVITTPDHKVWWKLGTGGSVELTIDAGKKWKTVDTGVSAQLTAGSAPSSKVCWIAGQAGTLVLTTDRGNRWTKLTTPITGDLGGIHAADAKHATIWDTGNRLSYQTSDGGATWKQTANE